MPESLATIPPGLLTICCNLSRKPPAPTANQSPTAVRKLPRVVLRAMVHERKRRPPPKSAVRFSLFALVVFLYCDFFALHLRPEFRSPMKPCLSCFRLLSRFPSL